MYKTHEVKGFTLIEIIVVMIIVGILATLGLTQYTKLVEKGRTAEAKSILGSIRTAEEAYKLEKGVYTATFADLPVGAPTACAATHFFSYGIDSADATTFTSRAARCTSGGKTPAAGTAYNVTINEAGNWGGTSGYY